MWFYDEYRAILYNTDTGVSIDIRHFFTSHDEGYMVVMTNQYGNDTTLMSSESERKAKLYLGALADKVKATAM